MGKIGRLASLLLIAAGVPAMTDAAELPTWAYALNPPEADAIMDGSEVVQVPDSTVRFTRQQIAAIDVQTPDWHPDEHPPMPAIVSRGRPPRVYACAYCHLPNGAGRPENASLAGLSAAYIKQQVTAMRSGARVSSTPGRLPQALMTAVARSATDEEIEAAAAYFASLKPVSYVRVAEALMVPKTEVAGWILTPVPDGGTEPIRRRILEMADDFARFEHRDSRATYTAYAAPGSIRRGALLATTGAGRTVQCVACHGPQLQGVADVPRLAGRSPSYLMRQLYDIQHGTRKGGTVELMKPVVANLTERDMLDLVAYIASLQP